jgi:hypothetical protein
MIDGLNIDVLSPIIKYLSIKHIAILRETCHEARDNIVFNSIVCGRLKCKNSEKSIQNSLSKICRICWNDLCSSSKYLKYAPINTCYNCFLYKEGVITLRNVRNNYKLLPDQLKGLVMKFIKNNTYFFKKDIINLFEKKI